MSSSTLTTVQTQLNFYGYPILMILGNIGNLFIIIFFSRQCQNACSIYLISLAIMNDLYLTYNGVLQIFPFNYTDQSIRAFILCKIRSYLSNIFGQVAKTMLVSACIDRFFITSERVRFRAFSTPKRAKWLIFFSFIFWSLISIHLPIMTTIINGQCGIFGIYSTIYATYTIVFSGFLPPIVLGIFGYLTYHNMRQIRNRIQPTGQNLINTNNFIQRRDRDLLIIVISEVFVYVITTTPYPFILFEVLISQYIISNKSVQYSQIERFTQNFAVLFLFINNVAPFYIYIISSKSFRRDFKKLMINNYRKLRRQVLVQITPGRNRTLTQQDTRV